MGRTFITIGKVGFLRKAEMKKKQKLLEAEETIRKLNERIEELVAVVVKLNKTIQELEDRLPDGCNGR